MDTSHISLLSTCNRKQLRRIDQLGTQITFSANRQLTQAGRRGRECMILLSGAAMVEHGGQTIAQMGPGDLVGEISAIQGRSGIHTANVVTTTDCDAIVFNLHEFDEMLRACPDVASQIATTAATRLAKAPGLSLN